MDQTQLKQNIAKYYEKLPLKLQEFFFGMRWMETLKKIGAKNSLTEEQVSSLAIETTLLLLAIVNIEDYKKTINTELRAAKEITDTVFNDVNELILKDIYEELESAFSRNEKELLDQKYGADKELDERLENLPKNAEILMHESNRQPYVYDKYKMNTNSKMDERFTSLPKEVQVSISESDYQPTLYSIAEKYKLNVEQMGTLEEITIKTMLNVIHPEKYEEELISNLTTLKKEDVVSMVKDVNENIFKKIKDIFKKHWSENAVKVGEPIKNEVEKVSFVKKEEDEEIPKPPYVEIKNEEKINPIVTPKNIIEEKLKTPTISTNTVSDHSISKTIDPYREEF